MVSRGGRFARLYRLPGPRLRSASLEDRLFWAPRCVRVERAPGGVLFTKVKPSLTASEPTIAVTRS